MNTIFEIYKKNREVIDYLFWGVMTTVVSWVSYSIFALIFGDNESIIKCFGLELSVTVLLANILSWICAVLFAYVTNKLWVFRSESWKPAIVLPEFGKFITARLITGVLEMVSVPLLVGIGLNQTILGIEGMLSKVLVSVVVVILNYVFSKLLIFKQQK